VTHRGRCQPLPCWGSVNTNDSITPARAIHGTAGLQNGPRLHEPAKGLGWVRPGAGQTPPQRPVTHRTQPPALGRAKGAPPTARMGQSIPAGSCRRPRRPSRSRSGISGVSAQQSRFPRPERVPPRSAAHPLQQSGAAGQLSPRFLP